MGRLILLLREDVIALMAREAPRTDFAPTLRVCSSEGKLHATRGLMSSVDTGLTANMILHHEHCLFSFSTYKRLRLYSSIFYFPMVILISVASRLELYNLVKFDYTMYRIRYNEPMNSLDYLISAYTTNQIHCINPDLEI